MTKEFKELLDKYMKATEKTTVWLHNNVCTKHKGCDDCPLYVDDDCINLGCPTSVKLALQEAIEKEEPEVAEDGTAEGAEHYKSCPIQPIDMMNIVLSHDEMLGFLKGNIIKYALRAGHKGTAEKDLKKMEQYRKWFYQFLDMGFVDVPEPEVKVKSLTDEDSSDDK